MDFYVFSKQLQVAKAVATAAVGDESKLRDRQGNKIELNEANGPSSALTKSFQQLQLLHEKAQV